MKKILSIVLAVAMLSTTAFGYNAATPGLSNLNPDNAIDFTIADMNNTTDTVADPASTTAIPLPDIKSSIPVGELTNANFSIVKKITKGSNLVKSVTIDDNKDLLKINLISDYTLKAPKAPNVVFEKLEIKSKKDIKTWNGSKYVTACGRGDVFKPIAGIPMAYKVGYVMTVDDVDGSYSTDGIVHFDNGEAYGEAEGGYDVLSIYGRVYNGDKIFTKFDVSVGDDQKAALKLYPEADLNFVNFTTSGLSSNNKVVVAVEEDMFVYEIKDGKVAPSSLKWDAEEGAYVGKTRSSVSYVISDIKLDVAAAATADPANPETGANDVVGIAAALAVVSLVAAGAVSLKK